MKKYYSMSLSVFSLLTIALLHGAAQEPVYKYALYAGDGTVIRTNAFRNAKEAVLIEKEDQCEHIHTFLQDGARLFHFVQCLEGDNRYRDPKDFLIKNKDDLVDLEQMVRLISKNATDRMLAGYYTLKSGDVCKAYRSRKYKSKYALRAQDGSVIKTRIPLPEVSVYMQEQLDSSFPACGVEQQKDGSQLIDVPLNNAAHLVHLVRLCELIYCDENFGIKNGKTQEINAQTAVRYALDSGGYGLEALTEAMYGLAYLSGQFGLEAVDQALIEYYKKHPHQTFVLREGLDAKKEFSSTFMSALFPPKEWTAEQRRGLAHIDTLLRGEDFFKRSLDIAILDQGLVGSEHCKIRADFWVWDKSEDVFEAYRNFLGDNAHKIAKMCATFRVGLGLQDYVFKQEGYLLNQERLEKNGIHTQLRFVSSNPSFSRGGGYGGPPAYHAYSASTQGSYYSSSYRGWGSDMWCP